MWTVRPYREVQDDSPITCTARWMLCMPSKSAATSASFSDGILERSRGRSEIRASRCAPLVDRLRTPSLAQTRPVIVPLAGCLLAGQGSRNSDGAGGEEVAESCRQLLGCVLGVVVAAGDGAAAQLGGPGPPDGEDVAAEVFQVVAADHSTSVGQVLVRRPAARSAPSASRSTPSPAR